jgi:hypothetical protein
MKNGKELIIIILLAIAVRIPWLAMIPQAEAPDENMHCWVINYISDNLRLPDRQAIEHSGLEAAYGSIPPFAYLPHIILLKLLQPNVPAPPSRIITLHLLITRLGSLFMSIIVVAATWWTGRKLFAGRRLAALAVPLLIVFHPQFVFLSSYANNDMTAAALASLILVNIILAFDNGLSAPTILSLAVLLSWLILSKYSGLHLLPIACLAIPISAYLHKQKIHIWLRYELALLFLIALMTGWWFIRNYLQFDGDITGVKTMNHLWLTVYHSYSGPPLAMQAVIFSSSFWRTLFFSFWGWFGYMTHSLPRIIYYAYLFFVLLSGCLGIRYWYSNKDIKINQHRTWTWLLFAACIILNLSLCAYCCCAHISGPQGRYLFPSEIPIMALLIAGLHCAEKKWSNILILAMLIFNFLAYCYSSFYLYRLYCQI